MNKETVLTDWNFMRILRFGVGIYIGVQAIETSTVLPGIFAAFFIFQALTNTGCCGSNGCAIPRNKNNSNTIEEVDCEEVK